MDLPTDLPPTQNSLPARPTTPQLGKALSELLDHAGNPDAAANQIAQSPALVAEARQALPALQHAATMKAGEDGVRKVLAKRFETYPQTQRSPEQWNAWFADYYDVLADCSLASLEAGMRAWVADPKSEFMPKPGQLRELAFTAPCRSLQRYYRAKRAIAMAEEPAALPGPGVDPAEVKEMMAEFQAKTVGGATALKPVLPSIAGKPAEGGHVTQAMRDLIARREGARP